MKRGRLRLVHVGGTDLGLPNVEYVGRQEWCCTCENVLELNCPPGVLEQFPGLSWHVCVKPVCIGQPDFGCTTPQVADDFASGTAGSIDTQAPAVQAHTETWETKGLHDAQKSTDDEVLRFVDDGDEQGTSQGIGAELNLESDGGGIVPDPADWLRWKVLFRLPQIDPLPDDPPPNGDYMEWDGEPNYAIAVAVGFGNGASGTTAYTNASFPATLGFRWLKHTDTEDVESGGKLLVGNFDGMTFDPIDREADLSWVDGAWYIADIVPHETSGYVLTITQVDDAENTITQQVQAGTGGAGGGGPQHGVGVSSQTTAERLWNERDAPEGNIIDSGRVHANVFEWFLVGGVCGEWAEGEPE